MIFPNRKWVGHQSSERSILKLPAPEIPVVRFAITFDMQYERKNSQ